MESNVKKIILNIVEKKLEGIVVIREDKAYIYGYGKESAKDLKDIHYSEAAFNLRNQFSEELEGLTDQQAINKLVSMEYIIVTDQYFPLKLIVSEEPQMYKVVYPDNTFEVSIDDFESEEEYNKSLNDIINNMVTIYKEELEELAESGLITKEEVLKESLEDTLEENGVSNFFVRNKRLLSGILIGAILTGVGIGLTRCSKPKSPKTPTKVEDNVDENVIEMPTVEPMEIRKRIQLYNEDSTFSNYNDPEEYVVAREVNGETYYQSDCLVWDELMDLRNMEISSIQNKIQSGIPLEGHGTYIYFENLFSNLSLRDRAFIKYFSMMGNEIIKGGYQTKNINGQNGVKTYAALSSSEVIRTIRDDVPIRAYLDGEYTEISFSSLSKEARYVVLNLAFINNVPLENHEFSYHGETLTTDNINDIILYKSEELDYVK